MQKKGNPWLKIDPKDYEDHMSHTSVSQLQMLSTITKEQLNDYTPEKVLILGVATGNGLEHISRTTKKVYGVDINQNYLDICNNRYSPTIDNLKLYNLDLNYELLKNIEVDLIVANLILEYVPMNRILKQFKAVEKSSTIISIVIQRNNDNSFVSETGITSLNVLDDLHRDICIEELINYFIDRNYKVIKEIIYKLPNGKEFIRVDLDNS